MTASETSTGAQDQAHRKKEHMNCLTILPEWACYMQYSRPSAQSEAGDTP